MPKKLLVGVNDLASQNTSILSQWDYELNTPLTIDDFKAYLDKVREMYL